MTGVDPNALLVRTTADALARERLEPVDAETAAAAGALVDRVRDEGEPALRELAERFGDVEPGAALVVSREALVAALEALPAEQRALLERTAARIRTFAQAQRDALTDVTVPIPGGVAGHHVVPVERAGCYAPGGRFPLPSSVLMTVVTAKVAGVQTVWVASPKPTAITRAAAAVAGADALLAVGGAQAVAALAYGAGPVPACDVIVGPGNRWVTAAKQRVSGTVGIDLLAGPSELVVLWDGRGADAALVAADLLAQAEHDPDARPHVVTWGAPGDLDARLEALRDALSAQLETLPTAAVALEALGHGRFVTCATRDEAIAACDRLAPEHLEVLTANARTDADALSHWGGLFVGAGAAEVLGDYGAGPNHTLPTGGTARSSGGLSVVAFLRIRTWMRLDALDSPEAQGLVDDAVALARLEGLEAHARSAEARKRG